METNPDRNTPTREDIELAHKRIHHFINRTPVITCQTINKLYDTQLFLKCENLQKVGAFKARGASNAVLSLDKPELKNGVATHSSGNHAQALSYAANIVGSAAFIVMPSNSSRVKVEAVKGYGGRITFCEPNLAARESTLQKILGSTGATEIHPYNNTRIIAGQATAALELIQDVPELELIIAPVGGGGLLSGTCLAARYFSPDTPVIAAEPAMADDAFQSWKQKKFIPSVDPQTIADGLRTSLGTITFPIIMNNIREIVTVSETSIVQAMRFLWERTKIIVEPSSAVPFAAIMEGKINVAGKRAGIIISGGNVDLDALPWMHPHG
jgi:threonine dehydratase